MSDRRLVVASVGQKKDDILLAYVFLAWRRFACLPAAKDAIKGSRVALLMLLIMLNLAII